MHGLKRPTHSARIGCGDRRTKQEQEEEVEKEVMVMVASKSGEGLVLPLLNHGEKVGPQPLARRPRPGSVTLLMDAATTYHRTRAH